MGLKKLFGFSFSSSAAKPEGVSNQRVFQMVNKVLNEQGELDYFSIFISENRNFLASSPVYHVYLISKWV